MPNQEHRDQPTQASLALRIPKVTKDEIAQLRADILHQLQALKLPGLTSALASANASKEAIRLMHAVHRQETLKRELAVLTPIVPELLQHFADGREVDPTRIDPQLEPVRDQGAGPNLFRLATLLWSVPVSKGYGRRLRYLVRDRSNGKLVGLFGLTDPVFNLRARDEWIGWDSEQRRDGLVHVMDAFVLGAVPPYSYLLGGKLIASLIGSAEVGEAFARRYMETRGKISGKNKSARLVLVTVTSALGRSSVYNRLRLMSAPDGSGCRKPLVELIKVGSTMGYGHFHLSEQLFQRLRRLVRDGGHHYADGHRYGEGPNWRIRVARVGLGMVGLPPDLIRHGIVREIYVMPLAVNCKDFLCGRVDDPGLDRPTLREITAAALERWLLPRARRFSDYIAFKRDELRAHLR